MRDQTNRTSGEALTGPSVGKPAIDIVLMVNCPPAPVVLYLNGLPWPSPRLLRYLGESRQGPSLILTTDGGSHGSAPTSASAIWAKRRLRIMNLSSHKIPNADTLAPTTSTVRAR